MIPGPSHVVVCPHCGFLARQRTLVSGNTFGAILWSDGKQEAPMMPEFPSVVKCRGCKRFYWVDEAEVIDGKAKRSPKEWEHIEYTQHLTIDEYIEALHAGAGSDMQKERFLRVHFWWAVNDIFRRNPNAQIPRRYVQELRDNFVKLDALLDEHDPSDRIMKAEIAREMGDFAESIRLLENVPKDFRWVANSIAEASRNEDSLVMQLPHD